MSLSTQRLAAARLDVAPDLRREFDFVGKLIGVVHGASAASGFASVVATGLKIFGATRAGQLAEACEHMGKFGDPLHSLIFSRWGGWQQHDMLTTLWDQQDKLREYTTPASTYFLRVVAGVPMISASMCDSFLAPISKSEILSRLRTSGARVLSEQSHKYGRGTALTLAKDVSPIGDVLNEETWKAIKRTSKYKGCRAWLFYGPPGGGKSTAARQLAQHFGEEGCLTLTPAALVRSDVWEVVESLAPRALILDDVDEVAERMSASALRGLERARDYARVIVMTANTPDKLRGALVRTGRGADETPVYFGGFGADTIKAIAPVLSDEQAALAADAGLLASYVTELGERVTAGTYDEHTINELAERMEVVGDR